MASLTNSLNPNKHHKEQFVSNLSGSSMLEIAAHLTIVPVLVLLRRSISSGRFLELPEEQKMINELTYLRSSDSNVTKNSLKNSKSWVAYMATMSVDFLFIIIPILLFSTVLSEWTYTCAILLMLLLLFSIAPKRFYSSPNLGGIISVRSNVSSLRVVMMIVTCMCILAVDFRIFPRRYAKTETYGTSFGATHVLGTYLQKHLMMDLGVGSFVLANSLVSRQARNVSSRTWKTAIQSTSPLLFLGFGRLVTTIGVDYQVHVGEYGVHWNFFFTLAAVSIVTSITNIPPQYSGIIGSLILLGYQGCLKLGLNIYLLSNERGRDIISQNKEGIFSIFGYWGMYLIGVHLGNYLFFANHSSASMRSNKWARTRTCVLSLLFWFLTVLLDRHVERVSRRMCNLPYVTMILAANLQVLAILMLSDYIPGSKTLVLEEAFNRNLLGSFLLANVLTGLVNLFVDTLSASSVTSLFILVSYACIISIVAGFADFNGIRLKFW